MSPSAGEPTTQDVVDVTEATRGSTAETAPIAAAAPAPTPAAVAEPQIGAPNVYEGPTAPASMRRVPSDEADANPMHAPVMAKDGDTLTSTETVKIPESAPQEKAANTEQEKLAMPPLVAATEAPATAYKLPEKASTIRKLTLEDVIDLAIKNSPERVVADAQISQAELGVEEARANYFPQANIKTEAGFEYNDPFAVRKGATQYAADSFTNNTTGNLRQMLYDGFITRETVRSRLQLAESSRISKAKITEELIRSTVEVYMELYQFKRVVQASAENLDALRGIADLVDLRVQAGDASKAEQNYVMARVASAQTNYVNAQAALRDAYAALHYLVGDVGEFEAAHPPIEMYTLGGPDDIIARALTASTDIRIIGSDQQAAAHDLQAARGRFSPEVAVVLDGNHAEDVGGQSGIRNYGSAKLQLSYRLFDGGLRKATTEKQYARLREIEARIERVKRELTQKVTRDVNKQQTAIKDLKITESEIEANTELEELYRKQFTQGDIDITNLVESQERIFSGYMKKYKLQSDIVNSTFSLMRSAAELLPRFCGNNTGC